MSIYPLLHAYIILPKAKEKIRLKDRDPRLNKLFKKERGKLSTEIVSTNEKVSLKHNKIREPMKRARSYFHRCKNE
uniref:Uncharacterized protein n=1 Tax=Pristionchus pacificus TaxID=54126 RepID=A0A2A6BPY4_PRIPA|eukprot:PDM67989.1 hypothetical protein PRIPAC_46033 [Pristionchus pacificus]